MFVKNVANGKKEIAFMLSLLLNYRPLLFKYIFSQFILQTEYRNYVLYYRYSVFNWEVNMQNFLRVGFVIGYVSLILLSKTELFLQYKEEISEKREERVWSVFDDTIDKFNINSISGGGLTELSSGKIIDETSEIFIVIEPDTSEKEVLTYLERNISKSDLKHYNIHIEEASEEKQEGQYTSL